MEKFSLILLMLAQFEASTDGLFSTSQKYKSKADIAEWYRQQHLALPWRRNKSFIPVGRERNPVPTYKCKVLSEKDEDGQLRHEDTEIQAGLYTDIGIETQLKNLANSGISVTSLTSKNIRKSLKQSIFTPASLYRHRPDTVQPSLQLRHERRAANQKANRDNNVKKKARVDNILKLNTHPTTDNQITYEYNLLRWMSRKVLAEDKHALVYFDINRTTTLANTLCPYADFCLTNSSSLTPFGRSSCCEPCYCDKGCNRRMDCCLQKPEEYEILKTNEMHCFTPRISNVESKSDFQVSFYMVDKCLSNPALQCRNSSIPLQDTFYPVYSASTDMIFFNRKCAECNGIYDSTNWTSYFACKDEHYMVVNFLSKDLIHGDCELMFIPPANAAVDKYICYKTIIDSCNTTGQWSDYDPEIVRACDMVWAPIEFKGKHFSNVFCKLCNGVEHEPLRTCKARQWSDVIEKASADSMVALVDYNILSKAVKPLPERQFAQFSNRCGDLGVMHPYKKECRQVLCPTSAVRTSEGCKMFVRKWHTKGYRIHVTLTPVSEELIPTSAFANLTQQQKENYGSWIDTAGIRLDHFIFHVEVLERNNISYVYLIDLEIGSKKGPVPAKKTLDIVSSAMSKTWSIHLNKIYLFKVKFHKLRYVDGRINFVEYGEYIRDRASITNRSFVLFPSLYRSYSGGLSVTKMYLCQQVQLFSGEWGKVSSLWEIKLNLTGTDNEKILGNGEFSLIETGKDSKKVRICVDDFNEHYYDIRKSDSKSSFTPKWKNINTRAMMFHLLVVRFVLIQ